MTITGKMSRTHRSVLTAAGACGNGGGSGGGSVSDGFTQAAQTGGTLTVWVDADRLPAAQLYQKEHPSVKLDIVTYDGDANGSNYLQTKVGLFNRTGSGWPDVVFSSQNNEATWAVSEGFLAPLNKGLIPASTLSGWATNANEPCTVDGTVYCLRNDLSQTVLWYNATLMKQWGYRVPTTWQQYQQLGEQVAAQHKGYIVGSAGDSFAPEIYMWASQCGANQITGPKAVTVDTTSSDCGRMAAVLDTLLADGTMSKSSVFSSDFDKNEANRILMLPGPAWYGGALFQSTFKTPAGQISAAAMPQWPGDNVAPDGTVGGLLEGRWYGGHYGWSWPHGWYSVGHAAIVAALAAAGAGPDESYLDLVRPALDEIMSHGKVMAFAEADSSIPSKWQVQLVEDVTTPTLHVPYRYGDDGWFDYNPMLMGVPAALWHHTGDPADLQRIERLRAGAGYDWRTVRSFRSKEEAGHEEPWLAFLAGDHPDYPEQILAAAQAQVRHRLARVQAYRGVDVPEEDIHLWQQSNPVVTEALVQLTWGGPQVIYNGGLQQARVRYYDADERRPGLPPQVAALVSSIDPQATVIDLVNLDPEHPHTLVAQAGAFAEHAIRSVEYTVCEDASWIGDLYDYGHRAPRVETASMEVGGPWLRVELPRSTRIRLTLALDLRANVPSYRSPFEGDGM